MTKRRTAILMAIMGFVTLVTAEFGEDGWELAFFATWFVLNNAAAVLFTMSKKQDPRRRTAPTGGTEQRDPLLLALIAIALAVAVGGSLADGAVGVGAAVLSACCFAGSLYGPRLQAVRWRKNP